MITFNAIIKGGKADLGSEFNKARFREFCKENEGKQIQITKYQPVRTDQQNRFYWFYLSIIERETGNLASTIHEYAKRKFLPPKFLSMNGEEFKIPASTTDLSKIEMGEYLDKICSWCEIPIPNPEELEGYLPH